MSEWSIGALQNGAFFDIGALQNTEPVVLIEIISNTLEIPETNITVIGIVPVPGSTIALTPTTSAIALATKNTEIALSVLTTEIPLADTTTEIPLA